MLRVLSLCVVGVPALLASGSIWAASNAEIGRNETACCTADNGQTVCGDITPPQCNGRLIRVFNRQGLLVRTIAARMTREEKEAIEANERRKQAALAAEREQRRQDQALLETYNSLADIDRMQKYAEDSVSSEISNILVKIGASQKKKQELGQEASFYDGQKMPPELERSIREEEMELKTQNELLAAKRRELEQIRQRFAKDRLRYVNLTSGQGK